ncbi:MAG: 30S ribosomal protein S20 [Bacteroidales bacterium]|jgi:small subunit ribosomal protein S20|nr:30S ribosomal protein S20 [Bacteroidales bacterium]
MANHKSSKKRIRSNDAKKERNHYYAKTMRNSLRDFRALLSKEEATGKMGAMVSTIDKLAKRGIIHKNKASNLKSEVMLQVNKLS